METITPFIWFDTDVQEVAKFYNGIFKNSKVLSTNPMSATIVINDQKLHLFNGGPHYKLNEAFSLMVSCETQKEIDYYWDKLLAGGGQESRCGWLKDKYGLSWQIIPDVLGQLIGDKDRQKADRAMQAMLKMAKLDLAALKAAHQG